MIIRKVAAAAALALLAGGASAAPFSYSCTDCPLAVPPAGTSGTTVSTMTVGGSGTITDLNLMVDITHTFTGDLEIYLEHGGTSVQVYDDDGGSSDDFDGTIFDDEAATPIADGTGPYAGSYIPFEALSAFDGMDLSGDWTLTIVDQLGGDLGTLHNWEIFGDADMNGGPSVPEPGILLLFGIGFAGMAYTRRRL